MVVCYSDGLLEWWFFRVVVCGVVVWAKFEK